MKRLTVFNLIICGLMILITLPLVIAISSGGRSHADNDILPEVGTLDAEQALVIPAPQYRPVYKEPEPSEKDQWAAIEARERDPSAIVKPFGTQILLESRLSWGTQEITSYQLTKIKLTDCEFDGEMPNRKKLHNKIIAAEHTDSSLVVDFSLVANCGSQFLCEAEYSEDNTLNLIYHEYHSTTFCNCCYGLEYEFRILGYDQSEYEDHPEITHVMFNGENKTKIPE